jgi:hypothetical protein
MATQMPRDAIKRIRHRPDCHACAASRNLSLPSVARPRESVMRHVAYVRDGFAATLSSLREPTRKIVQVSEDFGRRGNDMTSAVDGSQNKTTRVVGLVYLFAVAPALFAQFDIASQRFVHNNTVVQTARHLSAHERLFRLRLRQRPESFGVG